jgi:pyruvate formate lyase activating enzyme
MFEASFYEAINDGKLRCHICPHNCIIPADKAGICRQRRNISGKLYLLNYGKVTSVNIDPIEKKPLYHFYPGSKIISFGTNGCNLACMFCQNWTISQQDASTEDLAPEDVIKLARQHDSKSIAYTYNEPLMWFEFVRDCAKLARQNGLLNVLVTNGFINPESFKELIPYIDALNIDVKSFNPEFYKKLCKAKLEPVLETCITANKSALLEITNLVIPGENDSDDDFNALAKWVSDKLGKNTPIHFSAYHPSYKFDRPKTTENTLIRAYKIAKQHLNFVYLGNVTTETGNDTVCVKCREKLVERDGYNIKILKLAETGKCANCGTDNNIKE